MPRPLLLFLLMWMVSSVPVEYTFSVYSEEIQLRPSEVHNGFMPPVSLPPWVIDMFSDGQSDMVVTNFTTDIVDTAGGAQVPLYHVYNHHFALYLGTRTQMEAFYFAMHTKGLDGIGGIPCWKDAHPLEHCKHMGPGHVHACQQALQDTFPVEFGGGNNNSPSLFVSVPLNYIRVNFIIL